MTSIALQAKDISCYRGGRKLFSEINIHLRSGEILYCIGDNGSGKSSLLQILVGLLEPNTGEIYWGGESLKCYRHEFNQKLFYLGHKNAVSSTLTPLENIFLDPHFSSLAKEQIEEVLTQFKLSSLKNRLCSQLSQGQRQRVALMKLALTQAKYIVLDEPFSALDKKAFALVQEIIEQKLSQGALVIITTHQPLNQSSLKLKTIHLSQDIS